MVETSAEVGRGCARRAESLGAKRHRAHQRAWLAKGTIGISGLAGLFRAPEGIIPYSSVKAIQDALPQAKIVNATEMMQEIRAVKSAEEVSLLERSAAIVEKTIEAMVENANPGVSEKELYGAMVHAMLANGGELPTLFFLSGGPGISNSSFVPTDYRLQEATG
jgi:Xaa-Pro aminopeptidase